MCMSGAPPEGGRRLVGMLCVQAADDAHAKGGPLLGWCAFPPDRYRRRFCLLPRLPGVGRGSAGARQGFDRGVTGVSQGFRRGFDRGWTGVWPHLQQEVFVHAPARGQRRVRRRFRLQSSPVRQNTHVHTHTHTHTHTRCTSSARCWADDPRAKKRLPHNAPPQSGGAPEHGHAEHCGPDTPRWQMFLALLVRAGCPQRLGDGPPDRISRVPCKQPIRSDPLRCRFRATQAIVSVELYPILKFRHDRSGRTAAPAAAIPPGAAKRCARNQS